MDAKQKTPLFALSCHEATRLASESLDRTLTRRERWALRLHATLCGACRRFAQQIRWLRDVAASAPETLRGGLDGVATLSSDSRARIKRALAEARRADARD